MLTRRLALRRETLAMLSAEDMASVAAGAPNHTLEINCLIRFSPSLQSPTDCCQGIPTFHGAAC